MDKVTETINNIKSLFDQGWIVTVGLSGKDSFCVAHSAIEALKLSQEDNKQVGPLYLVTTDTTLDNFEVHGYLHQLHVAAQEYAQEWDLPVKTQFLKPALSSTPMVEYIGRGKLLRTPQTTRNGRDCAVSWKIEPMKKFLKEIENAHQTNKIVSLSGSRSDESAIRAANIEKRGETINTIAETEMGYAMAPIKDWTVNDVWSLIGQIEDGNIDSFAEWEAKGLRKHYAAGNGGTCDIFLGNNKSSDKACGARFGCVICSLVPNDRSLEQQIVTDEKQYGYMQPFVNLRTFMNNTLYDMERSRSIVGRNIDEDGWLKVNFNQYSMAYRQELLRYVLTIDAKEMEAAEDLGIDTRFQMIDERTLVAIQYHWSREGGERSTGMALQIWNEIHVEGKRYDFNERDLTTYSSSEDAVQSHRYLMGDKRLNTRFLHLDTFLASLTAGRGFMATGLGVADVYYNKTQGRMISTKEGNVERVVNVTETHKFTINEQEAQYFVNELFNDLMELGLKDTDPTEMLKLMLHHGVIQLRKGALSRLHHETKRAQAFNAMDRAGLHYETLVYAHSLTEKEKNALQSEIAAQANDDIAQMSLFA